MTLQFLVKTLCFFQRKYKRALAFSAEVEASPTLCGSATLHLGLGPHSHLLLGIGTGWKEGTWPRCDLVEQEGVVPARIPLSSLAPHTSSDVSNLFSFQCSLYSFDWFFPQSSTALSLLITCNSSNRETSRDCIFFTLFLYPIPLLSPTRKDLWSHFLWIKLEAGLLSSTSMCFSGIFLFTEVLARYRWLLFYSSTLWLCECLLTLLSWINLSSTCQYIKPHHPLISFSFASQSFVSQCLTYVQQLIWLSDSFLLSFFSITFCEEDKIGDYDLALK